MATILLVEDDTGIALPLSLYIKNAWYQLYHWTDWSQALTLFENTQPDLVILDINLPNKSGIEICKEIRQKSQKPIIVLSARNSEQDKLLLFELGVDDYVSKPFSSHELLARIQAVLKRSESKKAKWTQNKILEFWWIVLNPKQFSATMNNEDLNLTKTEFLLLEYCFKHRNEIITREWLMRDVMGYDKYICDRTIDTHIKNIRKKVSQTNQIETIRGIGYKFSLIS